MEEAGRLGARVRERAAQRVALVVAADRGDVVLEQIRVLRQVTPREVPERGDATRGARHQISRPGYRRLVEGLGPGHRRGGPLQRLSTGGLGLSRHQCSGRADREHSFSIFPRRARPGKSHYGWAAG